MEEIQQTENLGIEHPIEGRQGLLGENLALLDAGRMQHAVHCARICQGRGNRRGIRDVDGMIGHFGPRRAQRFNIGPGGAQA